MGLMTSMVPMWAGAEPDDAPSQPTEPTEESTSAQSSTDSKSTDDETVEDATNDTAEETEPTTEELLQQIDLSQFDIPIVINESVIYWVDHFSNSGRWTASRWIRASGKYRNLIRNEFKKANLPQDLLYMAMIESGFDPTAESHAAAVGIWQFIPETGAEYGLTINDTIDERRDPIRSTQAAIGYLSKLNKEFGGNWHLAMASYNAGERRIYKAVSEKGTINYWELRDALAEETQFYVPKILALAILDKYPELFGVPQTTKKADPLVLKQVTARQNQHVSTLAEMAEMDVEDFLAVNPHILKERLIVDEATVRIYVPPSQAEAYIKNSRSDQPDRLSSGRSLTKEELAELNLPTTKTPDLSHHQKSFEHTVTQNDSWESIATHYGLTVRDLQQWNPNSTLTVGKTLRLTAPKVKKFIQHTVQSSDSLKSLAKKYECSVEEIRAWNGLSEDAEIESGDVLWLKQ
jgi:membrane-bound lytic murein transglycosylase D